MNGHRQAHAEKEARLASILEQRARQLARLAPGLPAPPAEDALAGLQEQELVSFPLAGQDYAIPRRFVREIQPLEALNWTPLPCTPAYVVGVVNLRGRIYSIIDLARMFYEPERPLSQGAHLLLVQGGCLDDGGEMQLTLLADATPALTRFATGLNPVSAAQLPLSSLAQDYILGVIGSLSDQPASDKPVRDQPASDQPASDKPASDKPVRDQPASDQPASDQPASDEPASEAPASDKPVSDKPLILLRLDRILSDPRLIICEEV